MAGKRAGCLKVVGVFLAGTVVLAVLGRALPHGHGAPSDSPSKQASADTSKAAHDKQTDFAMRAGRALHASVRDPDSLVIEDGRVNDDATMVCINYRARNGFGGMNRESIAFDGAGKPHQSAAYWNAHCLKAMTVVTFAVDYGLSH